MGCIPIFTFLGLVRNVIGHSEETLDVLAGAMVGQLLRLLADIPGAKVVPGAFTSDRYMVALPKGQSSAAQSKLVEIVEAKKAGVVRMKIFNQLFSAR